ncbi:MAG: cadmium-translocating P-type ATPase [Firmicutes bacterium]|nr:cadmium-translocating P-type ATPase [Bacillota bacterium]
MAQKFSEKEKKELKRILLAAVLYAAVLLLTEFGPLAGGAEKGIVYEVLTIVLFLIPYLIVGYDVILTAAQNIRRGRVFDENFLMMLATFGAFGVRSYSEAVAVMLFYQVGEFFQDHAVAKSRQSISDMMDIVPEYANLEVGSNLTQVDPEGVSVGSIIVIKPGERVPLDGVITDGESVIDTAALTGESMPRSVSPGMEIYSGCVNGSGTLRVRTTCEYEDSTVARILELVEDASFRKARMENFITRFAKYYTPAVTIGAVILALIPPLVTGGGWSGWIHRACIFLIVSCPCALVISVPLGFFGGIGAASGAGVLVKGSNYLEAMADVRTVLFDKTGTLTTGQFSVTGIHAVHGTEEELLETAALAEGYSDHPIARSIVEKYGKPLDMSRTAVSEEAAGHGIHARIDGEEVFVGNARLMEQQGIRAEKVSDPGTVIHVARGGILLGWIVISDRPKPNAAEALQDIRRMGVQNIVMLTGDREEAARGIAEELGVQEVHAGLLPDQKVQILEDYLARSGGKDKVAFVGDGINDAPVLMRADIGVAMGSMGSDAAIEAADVVIMDDELGRMSTIIRIARKTMRIVKENIVFALGVKFLVLVLGAIGLANMWEAVFADVGVAVIAILNSMRTLRGSGKAH